MSCSRVWNDLAYSSFVCCVFTVWFGYRPCGSELPVEDGDMILCDDLTGALIAVDNQTGFESNDHQGEQSSHLTKVFFVL